MFAIFTQTHQICTGTVGTQNSVVEKNASAEIPVGTVGAVKKSSSIFATLSRKQIVNVLNVGLLVMYPLYCRQVAPGFNYKF